MPGELCYTATHLTLTISSCKIFCPQILHPAKTSYKSLNSIHRYLVPLTIAPAFLASSLYLCLCRIIIFHGQQISRFSPRAYAITFVTSDFISLVLQGAGGGLAATASNNSGGETGRAVMIAGVVFQVISLLIFMGLWLEFVLRLSRSSSSAKDQRFTELRDTKKFAWFQYALGAAVVLIFIRSVYRVAELQQGFNGPIANNQVSFMILEGPMIFLAVLAMTVLHPGIAFGNNLHIAAWSITQPRKSPSVAASLYMEDIPLQHKRNSLSK